MSVSLPPAKRQRADSDGNGLDAPSHAYSFPYPQSHPQPHPYQQLPSNNGFSGDGADGMPPPNWQGQGQAFNGAYGEQQWGSMPQQQQYQQPQMPPMPDPDAFSAQVRLQVAEIPIDMLKGIIVAAATAEPHGRLVFGLQQAHMTIVNLQRARVLNFDHYSKEAWHELNTRYARMSGSRQYDAAGDAEAAVAGMLDAIEGQVEAHSSYGTKKSAVETMRKIFKSTLLAGDVVGHEVRKSAYGWDGKFIKVLWKFTEAEVERLATEDRGEWVDKFREVVNLAGDYCIFERLKEGLDYIEGEEDEEEEEEESEEEDEEEDEGDGNEGGDASEQNGTRQ